MKSQESYALFIAYRSIDELKPFTQNARTHSIRQIREIAESIRVFSFTNPILIDRNNRIIAGHGRVEAAKFLGMSQVPTICIECLSEDQIRAYVIADNKLAENANWDLDILAIELQHLVTLDCAEFDATITGFKIAEIDGILEDAAGSVDDEDEAIDLPNESPVSEPGDLWLLGKHRLLCGNSLHDETYKILMGNRRAAAVFSDPPFNVKIDGHATGNGAIRHREFAMASGEMSEAEFLSFLSNTLRLLARYSANNSVRDAGARDSGTSGDEYWSIAGEVAAGAETSSTATCSQTTTCAIAGLQTSGARLWRPETRDSTPSRKVGGFLQTGS
jgi:ParB-like chromosome segregation protein Spo0J